MWVEETKNGKFKFVERYEDYMTGKTKKASVVMDKNTSQTWKLAQEALNDIIKGKQSVSDIEEITLGELIEKYRTYQLSTVKDSTYRRNYSTAEAFKTLLGADALVSRLNAQYIKDKFLATGKSPNTLNEYRKRLRAILAWGYENDYIADITWYQKFKPYKDETKKVKLKEKYLEPTEIKKLLGHIKKSRCDHWYLTTKFLLQSGLRFGEFAALRIDDISETTISVSKTLDIVKREATLPKTLSSNREIFIQPELAKTVKEIKLFRKKQRVLFRYESDVFMPRTDGAPMHYDAYEKYLRETSMKVLDRKITAHVLRHTHASILAAQGVNIETISRRLGHEDSKITKEIYLHVTKQLKERDNAALAKTKIL